MSKGLVQRRWRWRTEWSAKGKGVMIRMGTGRAGSAKRRGDLEYLSIHRCAC